MLWGTPIGTHPNMFSVNPIFAIHPLTPPRCQSSGAPGGEWWAWDSVGRDSEGEEGRGSCAADVEELVSGRLKKDGRNAPKWIKTAISVIVSRYYTSIFRTSMSITVYKCGILGYPMFKHLPTPSINFASTVKLLKPAEVFRFPRQVGAGSFGAVWKAHCRGQPVAVKCPGRKRCQFAMTMWSWKLQDGAPQWCERWFINPMNTIVISTINHSEMGVMFTNLANELGHHLVPLVLKDLKCLLL